jgi:hypothetical protein
MCELPFDLPALQLTMAWHARNDVDAAQHWLRESIAAVAAMHGGAPTPAADGTTASKPARKRARR